MSSLPRSDWKHGFQCTCSKLDKVALNRYLDFKLITTLLLFSKVEDRISSQFYITHNTASPAINDMPQFKVVLVFTSSIIASVRILTLRRH